MARLKFTFMSAIFFIILGIPADETVILFGEIESPSLLEIISIERIKLEKFNNGSPIPINTILVMGLLNIIKD